MFCPLSPKIELGDRDFNTKIELGDRDFNSKIELGDRDFKFLAHMPQFFYPMPMSQPIVFHLCP